MTSAASADHLSSGGDSLPAPVWVGLAMLGATTIGMALACLLICMCYIRPQRRKRAIPRPTDERQWDDRQWEHHTEDRELMVDPQAWPGMLEQAGVMSTQQQPAPVYPSQSVGETTSSGSGQQDAVSKDGPQHVRRNLPATGAEPPKPEKRDKSAMFGWDTDEEHSIARPPRLRERGGDSWEQEGESQDRNISRRAKGKKPATKAEPDLGTTTSTGGAQTGSMLAEVSKCTTSSEGVDTTVAVAAEEQAERPKAGARPAAAALRPAARRLRTPRGLPVPAEGPGSDKTIQHV